MTHPAGVLPRSPAFMTGQSMWIYGG